MLSSVLTLAQKRIGILTPSKEFILNDKMVRNFMKENKISRDSLANIILKNNSNQTQAEGLVIVNLNSQERLMTQYAKLKLTKLKRKVKRQEPLKINFWTMKIRKKTSVLKIKSASVI